MRVFVINELGSSIGGRRLGVWHTHPSLAGSRKGQSLHHFGDILTLCLFTSYTKTQMVELPVVSKPGSELGQPDSDQEESLPLKSVADRSALLVLALFTCPRLTHLASLLVFHSLKQCQPFSVCPTWSISEALFQHVPTGCRQRFPSSLANHEAERFRIRCPLHTP